MSAVSSAKAYVAIGILVALAAAIAYANALSNGATNFDDIWQITANPLLESPPTLGRLAHLLFAPYHGEYQPIKLLSYLADKLVCGVLGVDFVLGMHLTNVLLHVANSILVALLAASVASDIGDDRLRTGGTFFVGLLAGVYFALHPIHVESVAWLSGRKDLLSFLFMALAFLAFRRAVFGGLRRAGLITFALFLLALGSKATVISFPLIALAYWALLAWRGGIRILWLILALCAAAVLTGILGLWALTAGGYSAAPAADSYYLHFLTAIKAFPFYMRKMFLPVNLSAFYPTSAAAGLLDPGVLWGLAMLVAQIAVLFLVKIRMVRFILLWYLLSLLPVLQFFPTPAPSFCADRYAYIPSVPFAIAPAVILWQVRLALVRRGVPALASVLVAAGVLYAGALGAATWSRNRTWLSSETLWRDVLDKYPAETLALGNLGQYYFDSGDVLRSMDYFREAAKSNEGFLTAYYNLALAYERTGDPLKAREYYLKTCLRPTALTDRTTVELRGNAALGLARIYFSERKFRTARAYAEAAKEFRPSLAAASDFYVQADNAIKESKSLADDLIKTGDAVAESSPVHALELYRKAVEAAPEYPASYVSIARLYQRAGEFQKACDYYALAFGAGKSDPEFEYEYGVACLRAANYDVAAERLARSLAGNPSMNKAKVKLAIARAYLGEPAQALLMLSEVLDADPANEEARMNFQAIKAVVERVGKEAPDGSK